MGEEDNKEEKNMKQEIIDQNRKRYLKKPENEMTEDEKKEEEALRDLNNGPTSDDNRGCTDILCCLIFVAFLGGVIAVTILGFSQGQPQEIMYIYDEESNACGKTGTVTEQFPFLYLYTAISDLKSASTSFVNHGICVKQCPSNYEMTTLDCHPTTNNQDCKVAKQNIYLSTPLLQKLCIPSLNLYNEAKQNLTNSNSTTYDNRTASQMDSDYNDVKGLINTNFINVDKLISYLSDFTETWKIMLACVGIALVLGFVYLLLIRLCGACIAYITILLILAAFVLLGYFFQTRMDIYDAQGDTTYYKIMLAFTIIFYALAFIWLLFVLCSCNRIRLAIAITEVGAIFVWKVCSIIFVPFVFCLIVALYIAYWVALSVFLYSTGEISKSSSSFLSTVKW